VNHSPQAFIHFGFVYFVVCSHTISKAQAEERAFSATTFVHDFLIVLPLELVERKFLPHLMIQEQNYTSFEPFSAAANSEFVSRFSKSDPS